MIEFLLDILATVMAPQEWRTMSRPAIVVGVVLWGIVGAGVTLAGAAAIAHVGPAVEPWLAWGELVIGLLVLGDTAFAAAKFLRAKPEQS